MSAPFALNTCLDKYNMSGGPAVIVKNSFLTIEEPNRLPKRSQTFDVASLKPSESLMMTKDEHILGNNKIYNDLQKVSVISEDTHDTNSLRWSDIDPASDDDSEISEVLELMEDVLTNALETRDRKQMEHDCGECNPCIFIMKSGGCSRGEACDHCHFSHSEKYFKFTQKRNRAERMAKVHGDQSRFSWSWQEYSNKM